MVTKKGIEVNRAKVEVILRLTPPRSIKKIQALNGRVIVLSRFISRAADRSFPFFKILQQKGKFEWTKECQVAFEELKRHLAELPLLVNPTVGEVLFLYIEHIHKWESNDRKKELHILVVKSITLTTYLFKSKY